jgi:hypothetical protein
MALADLAQLIGHRFDAGKIQFGGVMHDQHHAFVGGHRLQRAGTMRGQHPLVRHPIAVVQTIQSHQLGPATQLLRQRPTRMAHHQLRGPHQPVGAAFIEQFGPAEVELGHSRRVESKGRTCTTGFHAIISSAPSTRTLENSNTALSYAANLIKMCARVRRPARGWTAQ